MRTQHLLPTLLLLLPLGAAAEEVDSADDISACMYRNVPEPDTIRAVRINTKDVTGAERLTIVRVYSRRGSDDLRQVLVEFRQPEEVRGNAFLIFEREGENEMYLRSKDLGQTKKITASSRSLPFLGTDFSYEDFEHLLAFKRPEETKRLADSSVQGRPVYVLESRPLPEAKSMYERVVTSVDQKTCVPLLTELFERGKGLRKKLVVDPMLLKKKGQMWLPQLALMEDLLNFTSTVFMVDSSSQGKPLDDELFSVSSGD